MIFLFLINGHLNFKKNNFLEEENSNYTDTIFSIKRKLKHQN